MSGCVGQRANCVPAAGLILAGLAGALMMGGRAQAAQVEKTEIDLIIDPNSESMTVQVRLQVVGNVGTQPLVCYFLRPTRLDYVREAASGRSVPYQFQQLSDPHYGVYRFTMSLTRLPRECVLELGYAYSSKDFYGWSLNPATFDNFVLGQITSQAVHSSHLYWYPYTDGLTGTARIAITVPPGWMGVSAGILQEQESLGNQTRFVYDIPYASGLLPYPLAAAPYVVQEAFYQDRVLVDIYSSEADVEYAREKLQVLTTKVLPFLEDLMGDYHLPNLRIVEAFPKEGNIGLAAHGLVLLSQKMWFAADIGQAYDSLPAIVLVDECCHQWNIYHVQFPNYLGEGISEYVDELSMERFVGRDCMAANMALYRQACTNMVNLLNRLKPFKDAGQSIEQAAQAVGMSVADITPFWPYASWGGQVGISDPRVFPTLYFIKGALALDALRAQLGDDLFFAGFKKLFSVATTEPVTLDYCRQCFESVSGVSLAAFFQQWYNEPGLPEP